MNEESQSAREIEREVEWRLNEDSADEQAEGGKCGGAQEEGATSDGARGKCSGTKSESKL